MRENVVDDGDRNPVDRTIKALSTPRDRHVVYVLVDEERVPLGELAERVAAREGGSPAAGPPEEATEAVRTSLYHYHLPKLDDLDVVDYDPRSDTVRYADPPPQFERFVELARSLDRTE